MKIKIVLLYLLCILLVNSCSKLLVKSVESPDINKGLLANYPFSGNANDESGNQYHGKVFGPELISDRFDKPKGAYYFDGDNDYISLGDNFNFDFNSVFSICAWLKTDEVNGLRTIISKAENSRNSNNLYVLSIHFQYPRGLVRDTVKQDINVMGSKPLTDNHWHFICLTYNGSLKDDGLKIYVDGILHSSGVKSGNPISMSTSDPTAIGCEAVGFRSRNFFHGSIDDIRIYNRVLSSAEIKLLFDYVE